MSDPEQHLRDLLAWREPKWDLLSHREWTTEAHRATQLAGAALAALHDGYRARGATLPPHVLPLADVVRAIAGEVLLHMGGPWDGGRDRFVGPRPDDAEGLLREFDALLSAAHQT